MPVSRMRMRPWLEHMIESNKVPGLHWVDEEKSMFSIPWMHAARHGWELNKDASLFKEWAIHTGKYVEGQASDPKTWKANFRCAMNSLPDIEEVKGKSVNKGHGAARVFRMLPVSPKSRDKRTRATKQRRHPKVKYEEDSSDSDCVPSPTQSQLPSPQSSPMDISADVIVAREQPDTTYSPHDEVPHWSSLGFELPRKFEVSPAHSMCPDDQEIIEICAQWERERNCTSSEGSNGFLSNEVQCSSPGSLYSESSSADDFEEPSYTNLGSSFSSATDDMMGGFYPFSSLLC